MTWLPARSWACGQPPFNGTTVCPRCGGRLRVIADITDPDLIGKILDHLNSRAPPRMPPARAKPRTPLPDLFPER